MATDQHQQDIHMSSSKPEKEEEESFPTSSGTTPIDISKTHKLALLADLWSHAAQNFRNPERFDVKKAKAALNKAGYIDVLCSRRIRVDLSKDTADFSEYDEYIPDWSGAETVKHMFGLQKLGRAGSMIVRNDPLDLEESVDVFYHGPKKDSPPSLTNISGVSKTILIWKLWKSAFDESPHSLLYSKQKAKAALSKAGYIDRLCDRWLRVDLSTHMVDFSKYDAGWPKYTGAMVVKRMLKVQHKKHTKKRKRLAKAAAVVKANKKPKIIWVKSDCNGELVGRPKGLPEGYEVRLVDEDADKKKLIDLLFAFMELQVKIKNTERYLLMIELSNYATLGGGYENGTIPIEFDDEEIGMFICNHFSEEQLVEYMTTSLNDMKSENQIKDASLLTNALKAYLEEEDKELPSLAFLERNMEPIYYVHGFDTTNFKKGGFQEVLRACRIPPIATVIQTGYSREVDRFLWKRPDTEKPNAEIITACNPITGVYPADKKIDYQLDRLNFAGYMGLRAPQLPQRAWALKHIRAFADHIKGESPDSLDFLEFELRPDLSSLQ